MIQIFTPAQTKILEALARYKFLTSSQMIRLGISNRRSNLSVMLKPLKETKRAFIGEMQFAFIPTKGRLENFYYLKPSGKKALIEGGLLAEEDIKIPKGRTVLFTQDYFHRKYTIDCHISCDLSAKKKDSTVVFFDRYFDKTGNNRNTANLQARTKIALTGDYIIADGTCLLEKDDISRLFALELYNDTNVKRIVEQIEKHIQGIKNSSLCRNYGLEKGHRLLAVFTHPQTKVAVMKKIEHPSMTNFLLFNDYEDVVEDFFEGWVDLFLNQINIKN